MISLVRKNLAWLITKYTSSARKFDIPYSLYLRFFSTRRDRHNVICPRVYDLLVQKHQFSPEMASLAASHLTQFSSPVKADSMLSFLEEFGFVNTQLEKIVKYDPQILSRSVECIKFKIKILQDLGLSSDDIKKIICSNVTILHLRAKNNIIPKLTLLRGLLGSDYDVARLLRKSGWFILVDLRRTLLPNVELLKSCGIPMEHIISSLYTSPRCFLIKPNNMRKSVDKAKELGFCVSSKKFMYAVQHSDGLSEGMWEEKLQVFQDLGFSDSDTLAMFWKAPQLLSKSPKKIAKKTELLLATGKFSISCIVCNPSCLGSSIDMRLKPRLRVLELLERRNLIKEWPSLGVFYTMSDDKFFERYIRPYWDDVYEALDTKGHAKGECKERLNIKHLRNSC